MADLAKLVVRLEAQTAQYQANLEKARMQLSKFDRSTAINIKAIGRGLATAAIAAAGALLFLGRAALESQDRLFKLSQSTGISTESLSKMEYAAKLSGVEAAGLATALGRLSRNMSDAARGTLTAQEAFEKIGVTVKQANGALRPTEDVVGDVADAFSKMEDGAAKAAVAQELFGRAGAKLIPFLNLGRAGLTELYKEAEQFGVVVRGDAAAAAEVFNDNLERVRVASAGVVNQVTQKMIPTLLILSERFLDNVKNGDTLKNAVGVLEATFKGLIITGTVVTSVFQQLGRILYGAGAALFSLVKGDFKIAAQEMKGAFTDVKKNIQGDVTFILDVMEGIPPAISPIAKATDDALKTSILFNSDKAGEEAKKAMEKALDQVQLLAAGMAQQVATYEQGEAAVIRYRIAHGDLAAVFDAAGPAGEAYKQQIIGLTEEMEMLRETTEKNAAAEAYLQELHDEGARVTESLLTPLERYGNEIERLNFLLDKHAISKETYNRGVLESQEAFDKAMEKNNVFLEQASRNVQGIISDALVNGFEDGAKGMLRSFVDMLLRMQAEAIAAKIAAAIFGGEGVGSGGGWIGAAAGALGFGGSMDSGGRGRAGMAYAIGTGAQPEMFVPDSPGTFIPNGAMSPQVTVSPQIINVRDPSEIPSAMQSRDGEQAILNVISRNPSAVRSLMQR